MVVGAAIVEVADTLVRTVAIIALSVVEELSHRSWKSRGHKSKSKREIGRPSRKRYRKSEGRKHLKNTMKQ